MRTIFTKAFWEFAGERAIKTAAHTAIAVLGTGAMGLANVDWQNTLSIVGGATLLSILNSVVSAK